MRKPIFLSLALGLLTAVILPGCTGCSVGRDSTREDRGPLIRRLTSQECGVIRLADERGVPLNSIAVKGWPEGPDADWGLVVARVVAEGFEEIWLETPLEVEPGEPVSLLVPVHPSEDPEGGRVELFIGQIDYEGERNWCDRPLQFHVAPLPPADPTAGLDATRDYAEEILRIAAESFSMDLDQLQKLDLQEIPQGALPLHFAARVLHDENALPRLLDDLAPTEREFLDRLFTQFNRKVSSSNVFSRHFGPQSSGTGDTSRPPTWVGSSGRLSPHESLYVPRDLTPRKSPFRFKAKRWANWLVGARVSAAEPINPCEQDVGTPCERVSFDELERLLGHQLSGQAMLDGGGWFIDGYMAAMGLPVISRSGVYARFLAWATKVAAEFLAHTRPSELRRSPLCFEPRELREDEVRDGRVDSLHLEFSSRGWDYGPAMSEFALMLAEVSATRALKARAKKIMKSRYQRRVGAEAQEKLRPWEPPGLGADPLEVLDYLDYMYDTYYETQELLKELPGWSEIPDSLIEFLTWASETLASAALETQDFGKNRFVVDPNCWRASAKAPHFPESIQFSFTRAITESPPDRFAYKVNFVGDGRVDAGWTAEVAKHVILAGLAASPQAPWIHRIAGAVEVPPIQVRLNPSRQFVLPGEVVTFSVSVDHAEDSRVRVQDNLGLFNEEFYAPARSTVTTTFRYRVPPDWNRERIQLTASSLSDRGLRDPAHPNFRGDLTAFATLVEDDIDIFIDAAVPCVERGDSLQLWAVVTGNDDRRDVIWRVVEGPGRIDDDGVLTPTGSGVVRVRAVGAVKPEVWHERTIQVGNCVCFFSGTLHGDTGRSVVEGRVAHFSTEGKATVMGAFTNPTFLEDMMSWGLGGGRLDPDDQIRIGDRQAIPEEWKREMESMPRETLGISLIEMDPKAGEAQLLAAMGGGFTLMASVVNLPISPGFRGALPVAHLMLRTGEYTEGGYPMKYEWSPGEPGTVALDVSRFEGEVLVGTIQGTLVAPGFYEEATGRRPEITLSIRFHARLFDPLNLRTGCYD